MIYLTSLRLMIRLEILSLKRCFNDVVSTQTAFIIKSIINSSVFEAVGRSFM